MTPTPVKSLSPTLASPNSLLSREHEISYLTTYPLLPADTPHAHPHIVDLTTVSETVTQNGLGFADLVATVLFNYDAAVLDGFLNLGKRRFEFKRKVRGTGNDFPFIERTLRFVTVNPPLPLILLLTLLLKVRSL